MDITKLDEKELKSLAYEQMKLLQQTQQNLLILENEIEKRKKENGDNTDK
jgi:hypothetical protein